MAKCPKCGANIDLTEDKFCAKCGQEIIVDSWECKSCGKINSSDFVFCMKCGKEKSTSKIVDDKITKELPNTPTLIDDKQTNKQKNILNMKVIAGILFVLAIVASLMYYQKMHDNVPVANNVKIEVHDLDPVFDDDDTTTTFRSVALSGIQTMKAFHPGISSVPLTEQKQIGDLYFKLPTKYPIMMQNTKLLMAGISEKEFIRVAILPIDNFPTSDLGDLLARKTHSVEDVLRTFQKSTAAEGYEPYAYVDFRMLEKIYDICFIHVVAFRKPSDEHDFYKTDIFYTYHNNTAYLIETCDGTNEFETIPKNEALMAFLLSLSYEYK